MHGNYYKIPRKLSKVLFEDSTQFPVIAVLGPRQSGKTTLVKAVFPHYNYISLENFHVQEFAVQDPEQFLRKYRNGSGLIIDEIQHAPRLLSYIQTIVDEEKRMGDFIVTGSQNFLITQAVTQSLAGRVAILTLLPLAINELREASVLPDVLEEAIFKGGYPRAYADKVEISKLYTHYITTYIERDVRSIRNIENLSLFQKFMRLCASRIGEPLNISGLANDCGIDVKTTAKWLSVLEASYIIFFIQPYYKTHGKRLIKAPKLFFSDTGVVCSLLRIRSAEDVSDSYLYGHLVENYIIADFYKQYYNLEITPSIYFWRDRVHEVDAILDEPKGPFAVEIKAGETINASYFEQLNYWQRVAHTPQNNNYIVYGGSEDSTRTSAHVMTWKSAGQLVEKLAT